MTDLHHFAADVVDLHRSLVRVTYAMSGDPDLAEDCAQEALLRAWQRIEAGERIDSLEAWSVTVALNWCRSRLRGAASDRRKVERLGIERSASLPADGPTAGHRDPIGDDVRAALLALPSRQREVVVLRYLLDMDVATIATTIDRSEGAVKNALHHARSALARSLRTPAADSTEDTP